MGEIRNIKLAFGYDVCDWFFWFKLLNWEESEVNSQPKKRFAFIFEHRLYRPKLVDS